MEWYEDEVRALELASAKKVGQPVFYGSCSFRLWTSLADAFDPRGLNLGFGGSTLEACDYYFERLIQPVKPRSLLLYAGDNDLGDGRSAEDILGYFQSLADKVKNCLGTIPFGFVSVKPSPARYSILDEIYGFNQLVRREIETRQAAYYVDVFSAMLDPKGRPREEFFLEDGLHMNHKVYRLGSRLLEQYRNLIFTT